LVIGITALVRLRGAELGLELANASAGAHAEVGPTTIARIALANGTGTGPDHPQRH
jgi:hypothetical protein